MKVTSKHADATLARLTNAMARNTSLATAKPTTSAPPVPPAPVATYAPHVTAQPATARRSGAPAGRSATGIRLKPDDNARIREVIQAGLELQETLAVSDVIRIALRAFDPRKLGPADIAALRAGDGRTHAARRTVAP